MAGQPNPAAEPLRALPWVELLLLVALAAVPRLINPGESLWLDELFTAWVALGSDGTLAERSALGNAMPPFYWLVKLSVSVFGPSEWALRLPSLVFGVLVPVAVYVLGRAVTGSTWGGRVAGLLAALDGLCSAYAAEARPYPLVQFFGAVQLLAFWALLNGAGGKWRAAFVAATVALGYTQFTALALVAGECAFYVLLRLRGERPAYTVVRFACDLAAAGVLLIPLVPLILTVAGRRTNFLLAARMVLLEDLVTLHRQAAYLFLPAAAAAVVAFARRPRHVSDNPWPVAVPAMFLVVVFSCTALPLWALHRAGGTPLFTVRYTTILLLLPLVGAALCAVRSPRVAGIVFALAALVMGQVTEGAVRRALVSDPSPRLGREDWRGALGEVNARGGTSPVFIRAGLIETDGYLKSADPLAREYLLFPVRTVYTLDASRRITSLTFAGDFATDADVEVVRQAGEAWFVMKGEPGFADPAAARAVERLARAGVVASVADRSVRRNMVVFRLVVAPVK